MCDQSEIKERFEEIFLNHSQIILKTYQVCKLKTLAIIPLEAQLQFLFCPFLPQFQFEVEFTQSGPTLTEILLWLFVSL